MRGREDPCRAGAGSCSAGAPPHPLKASGWRLVSGEGVYSPWM